MDFIHPLALANSDKIYETHVKIAKHLKQWVCNMGGFIFTCSQPNSHGVFWITHTWGGQILPAPLQQSHLKRHGFEIWHAKITSYCLFKTVNKFMQIS